MPFYVYENEVHDKAIVHHGSCRFCNDGAGLTGMDPADRRVDEWLGPFDSRELALAQAQATGKSRAEPCGVCLSGPTP